MFRPEPLDILIIVVVALLFFGQKRLPETARAFGKALREFRDAVSGQEELKTNETNGQPSDPHRDSR
jgi:sec-independent protein translocase protein TatA